MKRTLNNIPSLLIVLLMSFGLPACEQRVLEDIEYSHYVRVYIDDNIPNITEDIYNDQYARPELEIPEVMRIMLCNPASGDMVADRYLQNKGKDERGLYFDGYVGAPAGDYNLMVYNFDTEYTQVENSNNFDKIHAYTNPVSSSYRNKYAQLTSGLGEGDLLYAPNHLYTTICRNIPVSLTSEIDTLYDARGDFFTASSQVESIFLKVRIRGVQWISSIGAVITGMSPTIDLEDGKLSKDAVCIPLSIRCVVSDSTTLNRSRTQSNAQEATAYTVFNTFGKALGESPVTVKFEFIKTDGSSQVEEIDITSLFKSSDFIQNNWILIDRDIQIKPSEFINSGEDGSGGFIPTVDDWNDVIIDIII